MDPQTCFSQFVDAVLSGDLDTAAERSVDYNCWVKANGAMAQDPNGGDVVKLDNEQDRYLAVYDGGRERWVSVG